MFQNQTINIVDGSFWVRVHPETHLLVIRARQIFIWSRQMMCWVLSAIPTRLECKKNCPKSLWARIWNALCANLVGTTSRQHDVSYVADVRTSRGWRCDGATREIFKRGTGWREIPIMKIETGKWQSFRFSAIKKELFGDAAKGRTDEQKFHGFVFTWWQDVIGLGFPFQRSRKVSIQR